MAVFFYPLCLQGMLTIGLFVEQDKVEGLNNQQLGLFKGGGVYSLGVQALACVCLITWSAILTFIILLVSDVSPLR